jgi:hypothetical protein
MPNRKINITLLILSGIVCTVLCFNILTICLVSGSEIKEVKIEKLYKNGVIDVAKLMYEDSYYLKTDKNIKEILYLKRGIKNLPFILDIKNLSVQVASEEQWETAVNELKAPTRRLGHYISDGKELRNIYTQQIFKPFGQYIIDFSTSPDDKYIFIYSFSGYYRESKGIGFLVTSSSWKIGMNFFEIWDISTHQREVLEKKLSFSISYWPDLLFWLEDLSLMIFSNNYNKSLLIMFY